MADIPNRDELERKIARLLGRFNRGQLGELLEMMGNSPKMSKIPPSFWTKSEQALAAELIPFSEDVYLQAAQRVMESVPVGVDWSLINQAAADWAVRDVGKLVTKITDTTRKGIGRAVSSYFTEAQTIGDLELRLARMKDKFKKVLGPVRAEGIAVTEITRAAAEGERGTVRELKKEGVEMVEIWQTNNDDLVCPICGPRHGKKEGTNWDRSQGPPAHPRCLPGDALILSIGQIAAGSKRWYEGNVVIIETLENKLTVTPNHPILTPRGWVAAGLLQQGDNIFSHSSTDWKSPPIKINEKYRISSIKDIFGSLDIFGFRVPTSAPDFHNDGAGSKVAVIRTNSKITNGVNSYIMQPVSQSNFFGSNIVSDIPLPHFSTQAKFIEWNLPASGSFMGSLDLPFALPCGHIAPFDNFSLGLSSGSDASIDKTLAESLPIDSSFLSQLIFGLPGLVSIQEIVKVGNDNFSGHVYNLQTSSGLYVADGIITHNCRCWINHEFDQKFDPKYQEAAQWSQQQGFNPDNIHLHYEPGKDFVVGGSNYRAAGHYRPDTDEIHLFEGYLNASENSRLGMLTHEIQHSNWDKFEKLVKKDSAEIDSLLRAAASRADDPIYYSGKVKPEYLGRWKGYETQQLMLGNQDEYMRLGGVTQYSESYWVDVRKTGGKYYNAVNETLAEIGKLKSKGLYKNVPEIWQELYEEVAKATAPP